MSLKFKIGATALLTLGASAAPGLMAGSLAARNHDPAARRRVARRLHAYDRLDRVG
jgi:hypothetical protein